MINIALPKGRLGARVCDLLTRAGYDCAQSEKDSRQLVIENPKSGLRCFLVKPSDVPIYVAHRAADIGVAGKDVLLEQQQDIYQLIDLHIGRCRMAVAAKRDYIEDTGRELRVATKYVHIAREYYASINREIQIIQLHGSIELAPLLGLSDVIVDIVETGQTLRENHLQVLQDILPISAWLIANKASYTFQTKRIDHICTQLRKTIAQEESHDTHHTL